MKFVESLERILKEKNISKKQMLSDLNLAINSFVNWKKRGNTPNGETLSKIAEYLNVSISDLLGEEKETSLTVKGDGGIIENVLNTIVSHLDENQQQDVLKYAEKLLHEQLNRKKK